MGTVVIGRLRSKFFRGRENDEHLVSFRVWLTRKQKKYRKYMTVLVLTDAELCQHYLEEMIK